MTGGLNIHFILIIPQITPGGLKASPGKALNRKVGLGNASLKICSGSTLSSAAVFTCNFLFVFNSKIASCCGLLGCWAEGASECAAITRLTCRSTDCTSSHQRHKSAPPRGRGARGARILPEATFIAAAEKSLGAQGSGANALMDYGGFGQTLCC